MSERKESVVYVLQNGGEVAFPAINLTWWDIDTQELKTMTLDGQSFSVSHTVSSWLHQYWQWLAVLMTSTIVILFIVIKTVRYYQTHPLPAWFMYSKAVNKQEWGTVRVLLYRTLRIKNKKLELKHCHSSIDWQQDSSKFQSRYITKNLSSRLWKRISPPMDGLSSLCSMWKPKAVFPQFNQLRKKYVKNQENQHKRKD